MASGMDSAKAARLAPKREIFAWAMYDFANSGYTTVVLTTIYNAYFVSAIAGHLGNGHGTLMWTIAIAIANGLVVLTAPLVGALADSGAHKKRFLIATTTGCVGFTAMLAFVGPGDVWWAMLLVIGATVMFAAGESLIAAFLPELAAPEDMGRISGYGWSLGYFGGLLSLALCLAYINHAKSLGHVATQFVPVTMLITAAIFMLAAMPTFLWLNERSKPRHSGAFSAHLAGALSSLRYTLSHIPQHRDLFLFLLTLMLFHSGIYTVIVIAAVYASEVMGFGVDETIMMIMLVNITSAVGAFSLGYMQDRIGSVRTLALSLLLWIAAMAVLYFGHDKSSFWIGANLIGLAMGSSQSASRALVGQFAPAGHAAEIFGLWGLVVKLAAMVGPLSYGAIAYVSDGNHRLALLATSLYFIAGFVMLMSVDEKRGRKAAQREIAR